MIYPLAARRGMITPLARGIQRADTSWWLAGGISAANCVAAYQAKGAASYVASKVNLANPGTLNFDNEVVAPSWNTTTGWTGAGDLRTTGTFTRNQEFSFVVFCSSSGAGYYSNVIETNATMIRVVNTAVNFRNTDGAYVEGDFSTPCVLAILDQDYYLNKTKRYTIADSSFSDTGVLRTHTYSSDTRVYALAVYSTKLSEVQYSAVVDAMTAL